MTDPKEVADLVAKLDRFLSGNFYAPPVIREALEASFKTLETLSSELERVKGERDALADFARWVITESAYVQDKAVEAGLLVATKYDPEQHGPSDIAEPGDDWFVFSPALASIQAKGV
jgi:hypothetical protein